jgi:hypothetical protein
LVREFLATILKNWENLLACSLLLPSTTNRRRRDMPTHHPSDPVHTVFAHLPLPRPNEFLVVQDPLVDKNRPARKKSAGTIFSLILCVFLLWVVL